MTEVIDTLQNELAYNSTITVGATSVKASLAKNRKSYVFRNSSTGGQVITLAFSNFSPAVANNGIVLQAGQFVADSNSQGYFCWSGEVQAIADGAGATLSVMEAI